jgi:hypothetical protein
MIESEKNFEKGDYEESVEYSATAFYELGLNQCCKELIETISGSDRFSNRAGLNARCAFYITAWGGSLDEPLFEFSHIVWNILRMRFFCSVSYTAVDLDFVWFQCLCGASSDAFLAFSAQIFLVRFIYVKFSCCQHGDQSNPWSVIGSNQKCVFSLIAKTTSYSGCFERNSKRKERFITFFCEVVNNHPCFVFQDFVVQLITLQWHFWYIHVSIWKIS